MDSNLLLIFTNSYCGDVNIWMVCSQDICWSTLSSPALKWWRFCNNACQYNQRLNGLDINKYKKNTAHVHLFRSLGDKCEAVKCDMHLYQQYIQFGCRPEYQPGGCCPSAFNCRKCSAFIPRNIFLIEPLSLNFYSKFPFSGTTDNEIESIEKNDRCDCWLTYHNIDIATF